MRHSLALCVALLLVACGEDPVLTPSVPTTIARVGNEVGTPGWRLSDDLSVVVRDHRGEPLEGVTVEWSSPEEGAWFGAESSETDGDGVATVAFAPGWRVGDQQVRVTIGALHQDVAVEVSSLNLRSVTGTGNGSNPVCGLDQQGVVWCFMHDASRGRAHAPIAIPDAARPVNIDAAHRYEVLIGIGTDHSPLGHCGLTTSHLLRCWEYAGGLLEIATPPTTIDTPVPLVALTGAYGSMCGLDADGQAWCRGANSDGQLGDGTTNTRATFAPVVGAQRFGEIAAGYGKYCALDLDARVWCWGASYGSASPIPSRMAGDMPMRRLGFSYGSACGIGFADHQLYCWWGGGMEGVEGNGTDAVLVPGGGGLVDFAGIEDLGVFLWGGGRVGFAGDMAHDVVVRWVRRPADLTSSQGDFLPALPDGFGAIVSRGGSYWCGMHTGGATLCSYRIQALQGIPAPQ